jgi:hypothetical protein
METPVVTSSTQVAYPWRASLRTGLALLAPALIVLATILTMVTETYADLLPAEVTLWLAGAVAFLTSTSVLINRIMNIPGVDAFLTKIGLGAAPKETVSVQVPVEAEVTVTVPEEKTGVQPYKSIFNFADDGTVTAEKTQDSLPTKGRHVLEVKEKE